MPAEERGLQVARLAGGLTLPYVDQGDPTGVPVVLLHGLADSWRSYEVVLAHLSAPIRALVPSLRGHGDAGRPATGYTPGDLAEDLAGLLDAAGVEAAVVAGHSSAALVAQRFALDRPSRTLGLILVGAFAALPRPVVEEFDPILSGLADPVDEAFIRRLQEGTLAGPAPPGFLDTVVQESRKVPAHVWREVWAGVRDTDLSAELGRIAAQTIVIWGDRDHLCSRAMQDALVAAIPAARLSVYPGAGHAPHWEDPARFASEVGNLCRELAG